LPGTECARHHAPCPAHALVLMQEWDLQPEELEEQRSLAAGGYVGVRRVARLLEVRAPLFSHKLCWRACFMCVRPS